MGSHTFATNKHIHHTLLPHSSQMLRILALAAGVKAADWAGTNINVTTSWESNDDTSAGGIVTFESPADAIANGTGSCTVTISTVGLSFVHFFNAHVGTSGAAGTYELSAHGAHQDTGVYQFLVNSDEAPVEADFDILCQDDAAVSGPVFDSFPQDAEAATATGSFTWEGDLGSDSVVMDFGVGNAPTNFTMHDPRLAVQVVGDTVVVSNMGAVNYDDVGFDFVYTGATFSAYDITLAVVR